MLQKIVCKYVVYYNLLGPGEGVAGIHFCENPSSYKLQNM